MASSSEQIEKIAAIVALLDDHLDNPPASNRRRQKRLPIRMALTIGLLAPTGVTPVEGFLRNISLSGMGFVSRRMFRKDERIAVSFRLPKMPPKQVLARIAFARYVRAGLYEMGAEFLQCVTAPAGEPAHGSFLARIPNQWLISANYVRTEQQPAAAHTPDLPHGTPTIATTAPVANAAPAPAAPVATAAH